jgi:hypothetical protein
MNKVLIAVFLFLFLPVILAGAIDFVGDHTKQPDPINSTDEVNLPDRYNLEYGTIPPSEYNLYTVDTTEGQLDLVVINGTRFSARETLSLLNTTTQMGLASPPVTGYVVGPTTAAPEEGRAYGNKFWASPDLSVAYLIVTALGDRRTTNVPVHEYVHTGQWFYTSSDMEWYIEAEAEFYGVYIPQKGGEISAGRYNAEMIHRYLRYKSEDIALGSPTEKRLQNSDAKAPRVDYMKGSVVLSALDGEIREKTGGDKTILDLSRGLRNNPKISHGVLNNELRKVTGTDMSNWTERYVAGNETPQPRLVKTGSPFVLFSTGYWLLGRTAFILLVVTGVIGYTLMIKRTVMRYVRMIRERLRSQLR